MRVVLEHDSGEIWGQHEIEGLAADHLLEALSGPPKDHLQGRRAAASLVEDLRVGSLAEIARRKAQASRAATDFNNDELFILYEALESYWFDCSQGGDDELKAKKPAIEALRAKIERVL